MGSCVSSPEGSNSHNNNNSGNGPPQTGYNNGNGNSYGKRDGSPSVGLDGGLLSSSNGGALGGGGGGQQEMMENKRANRERSVAIDKQIEEDSKKYRKECKILLLGELLFIKSIIKGVSPFRKLVHCPRQESKGRKDRPETVAGTRRIYIYETRTGK